MRHDKGMLIPVRIGLIGWGGKTFGAKVGKAGSNKSVTNTRWQSLINRGSR